MAEKYLTEHNKQALVQAGLTPHQAALYEVLVQRGSLPASKASFLASVPRTLGYKVLDELEELGLVTKKDEKGKISRFSPAHPLKLKELAEKRLNEAKDAKNALDSALAKLISDFNTVSGAPGIRILEGVAGFAELFEDQLNEQQPILIIRSPKYVEFEGLSAIVRRHLDERTKLKIPVRSIEAYTPQTPQRRAADVANKVERRFVRSETLSVPADVVIYGNKVAINAYQTPLMTTIIENTAIRATFGILFEYIWKMAEPEHQKILATI